MIRHMSFVAATLLLAFAGSSRAQAAPTPLPEGTKAPDFEGKEFVNGEACSLRSLRGQVVFLEIFRTWCGPCKKAAPHLTELHEKYGSKGLRVIGITNEARGLVDKFLEDQKAHHMIVIEASNSGANYGTSSVPSPWLIGADGRILLKGTPSETQIEEALQKVRLAPTLPKSLEAFAKDVKKEKYGEVRTKVSKMLEGTSLSEADRKAAEDLVAWVDWQAESALSDAKADGEKGDWYEASLTLERVKKCFVGQPAALDATEQLKAIQADKEKKDAVAAGKRLQAALEDQREKNLSPKEAIPIFRAIEKKYGDTLAGKKAAAIVDTLEADIARKD
jgi:thiol-disulfide isomerase/thioredoxin